MAEPTVENLFPEEDEQDPTANLFPEDSGRDPVEGLFSEEEEQDVTANLFSEESLTQQEQETSDTPSRFQGLEESREESEGDPSVVGDMATQTVAGSIRGILETGKTANFLAETFIDNPIEYFTGGDGIINDETMNEVIDEHKEALPEPKTLPGALTGTVSQFAVPYAGASKVVNSTRLAGNATKAYLTGAIADFSAFDAHEERLSNALAEADSPILNNHVTRALAADEDDSEVMGRLKQVAEGMMLGAAADNLVNAVRVARGAQKARSASKGAEKTASKIRMQRESYLRQGLNEDAATHRAMRDAGLDDVDPELDFASLRKMAKDPNKVEVRNRSLSPRELKKVNNNFSNKFTNRVKQGVIQKNKKFNREFDRMVRPVHEAINQISPRVGQHLRKFEFDSIARQRDARNAVIPLRDSFRKIKRKNRADYEAVKRHLLNAEEADARAILRKYDAEGQFDEFRRVADNMHKELTNTGVEVGYIDQFFPRMVKDAEGLARNKGYHIKDHFDTAINQKSKNLGRKLTEQERADVINSTLRSANIEGKFVKGSRAEKPRQIEYLDDTDTKFYADPEEALLKYVDNSAYDVEKNKFLGRVLDDAPDADDTIENSIGRIIDQEVQKGNILPAEKEQLDSVLRARFGPGETAPASVVSGSKNIWYTMLLANPGSALVQFADNAVAAYRIGVAPTVRAMLSKKKVDIEDIGLDKIMQELESSGATAKFLQRSLSASGFRAVDRMAKNTVLNASLRKNAKKAATKKGREELYRKYRHAIPEDEWETTMQNLRNGRADKNSKLMMFNDLADQQPISLSEMPEFYLKHPNGRLFYTLRTFMLKQIDLVRQDVLEEAARGNKTRAGKNLARYAGMIGLANMTIEDLESNLNGFLKEAATGEPHELEFKDREAKDVFLYSFMKNWGMSDYMTKQVAEGRLSEAALSMTLPPINTADDIAKDLINFEQRYPSDFESTRYIPVVGKTMHKLFSDEGEDGNGFDSQYDDLYDD